MARVKKPAPTLDSFFFATTEQKVLRFLLTEPTTTFTPRVICSRLKGLRGLGGADGVMALLTTLQQLGLVDFVDNQRAVRIRDDNPILMVLKSFASICDLEGLKDLLVPHSSKGILFGCRAEGTANSDSTYDLMVVTQVPDEVKRITAQHPLGKQILLTAFTPENYSDLDEKNPELAERLSRGIQVWGSAW